MVINHSPKGGKWCSVLMRNRGRVYWAMAGGKRGKVGKGGEENFPISFPNFPLISTFVPICPHFTDIFPRFPPFPPSFPHSPPNFPIFPFFLGNIVGYLIAGRVGDFWALYQNRPWSPPPLPHRDAHRIMCAAGGTQRTAHRHPRPCGW